MNIQHLGPHFGVCSHVSPAAKAKCTHVRLMRHPNPSKLAAAATAAELKALAHASFCGEAAD